MFDELPLSLQCPLFFSFFWLQNHNRKEKNEMVKAKLPNLKLQRKSPQEQLIVVMPSCVYLLQE